jgi:actin
VANKERIKFIFAHLYNHYFPNEDDDPDELRVIFNETPFSSKENIKFLAETAFDLLGATELSIKPQGIFAQTPFTLKTAICIDIGHDIMQCVPMSDGYAIPQAIKRSFLGGKALDLFISRCVFDKDEIVTFGDVKELEEFKTSARVPANFNDEATKISEDDDEGLFRITCGEIFFQPKLMEDAALDPDNPSEDKVVGTYMESPTPAQMVASSIELCDLTLRGEMWSNIIVTGGSTKMSGFRERFEKELEAIKPPNVILHCRYPEDPVLATWAGEAVSAKFDAPVNWLNEDDYEENHDVIFEKFRLFGTSFAPTK